MCKKKHKYKLSRNVGTVMWGDKKNFDLSDWKNNPHSYAHTGDVLFIKTEFKNIACDFEVEGTLPPVLLKQLKIKNKKDFYKVWVIAETIAKLKNIPILEFLKKSVLNENSTTNLETVFRDKYILEYKNIGKYHFAIGYVLDNQVSVIENSLCYY